ncbi:phosphonate metabolism protein/1,5-bisphosphokinase (PRPP-forming) PhnN [Pseudomonas fulva]|uniref:phosphonate metabolism protein/1,5-bisphosphokinase (PRPP-forming) PhnN n=1 Tax=Pseudomonas fulva TaxID=47880 RepID=UPI000F7753E1|nr:phosphonate metabolism protein/1,5-bisphosphokinase (PRPP-forming) PhnN [Pseudomonas fulva]MBA1207777.1 phosphonate metabolism protein/1,5-bisphosphokinase (PRPP-forming) PhnN [Pseudomonas fulva]MBA1215962.1 phosphonate metabolism protein/1,5-bisphosphokinase (PRPP-forming) PhnN [Pseudomonas fulva]MDH0572099.1 phosphonate metabolism protein/1,5-bisphosphokinase (PRPP-forming) PhnN [Pseudomonas fulva]RRW61004.1 phosphonate metabolism protein/1,5-bisphosphokinase (PRPP-forming) PhnN [Pseudomon
MHHDASCVSPPRGKLILLIGPSGAGKDSLIDAARPQLAAARVEIARRVITRSAEAKGEAAVGVDAEQFERMKLQGAFAMHWQANGLQYGIPRQIDEWLAQGRSVLVNGSRGHLPQARIRYPDLLAIRVDVSLDILRQRLQARGRETQAEIDQRLARHVSLSDAADDGVRTVDNSTTLSTAVEALLGMLREEGVIQAH